MIKNRSQDCQASYMSYLYQDRIQNERYSA